MVMLILTQCLGVRSLHRLIWPSLLLLLLYHSTSRCYLDVKRCYRLVKRIESLSYALSF
jgi:hypothetical protein